MSKQRWFDRNGVEIYEGDIVRNVESGEEELVYACHPSGYPDKLNLGLNASNENFLRLHPGWDREIYPFDTFSYNMVGGERRLQYYEKVI